MDEFLIVLWSVIILTGLFTISLGISNNRVYKCRIQMLDEILFATNADVNRRETWQWRYEEFNRISYHQHCRLLMLRPWKDPREFYDDLGFLDPSVRRGAPIYGA